MKHHSTEKLWGRFFAWVLAVALLFSNLESTVLVQAAGENAISIQTAEDLAKI